MKDSDMIGSLPDPQSCTDLINTTYWIKGALWCALDNDPSFIRNRVMDHLNEILVLLEELRKYTNFQKLMQEMQERGE